MIEISLKFPDLAGKLTANMDQIQNEIVAAIQFNRGMLFDSEGAYNGHKPWAQLELRTGQALSRRGVLRKSLSPGGAPGKPGPGGYVDMDSQGVVTVGTSVAYAAMMNFGTTNLPGGVLRPVRAKALAIPLPEGKWATDVTKALRKGATKRMNERTGKNEKVIFRKWVKIPARRFDTITSQDTDEFAAAAKAAIVEALK